jgi:hypothetical protein
MVANITGTDGQLHRNPHLGSAGGAGTARVSLADTEVKLVKERAAGPAHVLQERMATLPEALVLGTQLGIELGRSERG